MINLSTSYEQQPDGSYRQSLVYTRADNPPPSTPSGCWPRWRAAGARARCSLRGWRRPLRCSTPDLDAVAAAIRPGRTRLLWVETPANPVWEVTDLGHQIAARQMHGGFGGMLSIRLSGGAEPTQAMLRAVRVFKVARAHYPFPAAGAGPR